MADWNTERAITQNLADARCDGSIIEQYFSLDGKKDEQLKLLAAHRKTLLDTLHKSQKALDCLDFLLYKLRREA